MKLIKNGAVSAVILAAAVMSASPPATAGREALPTALVTMGDSFMSGEGGRWQGNSSNYDGQGNGSDRATNGDPTTIYGSSYANGCDRSNSSEALSSGILDKQINIACSGAETVHIFRASQGGQKFKGENPQADQLAALTAQYDVQVIALSIGGNDLGFADIIKACVTTFSLWGAYCNPAQQKLIDQKMAQVKANVDKAIREIKSVMYAAGKQPGQFRIILQSGPSPIPRGGEFRYPETIAGRWTTGGCPFYDQDATWARDSLTGQISGMQADVATAANIDFLDLRDALQGREVCANGNTLVSKPSDVSPLTSEWVRYLVNSRGDRLKQESLHPNYFGQLGLGRCLAMISGNPNLHRAACRNRPGVDAAGMYLVPFGTGLPDDLPDGWTACAGEGGTCTFTGRRTVGYGAGQYRYAVADGSIACGTAAFGGDPAWGVLKSCFVAPVGGPANTTACAVEAGICAISSPTVVSYGANGSFVSRLLTKNATCGVATFGSDPLVGFVKSCYPAPATPGPNWKSCAAENGTCSVSGRDTIVAYGAQGSFVTRRVTGSIPCTYQAFGIDPNYGVGKSCYTRSGGPSGYATKCADEAGNCAFTGSRTVAYGAAGDYVFKTFSGGPVTCGVKAFGSDPRYGIVKSCYLTP